MALLEWFLSDGLFEGLKEGFHSWKKERVYPKTHVSKTRLNFIIQCLWLCGTIVFTCLEMQEILLFTSLFKNILKEFHALLMQVLITHRWQRSQCIYLLHGDLTELQRVTRGCVTSLPRQSYRVKGKPVSKTEERFRSQKGEMDAKIHKKKKKKIHGSVWQHGHPESCQESQSLNLKHHFTTGGWPYGRK